MNNPIQKAYQGVVLDGVHHFALRVYIEDTDLGGVVYHSNYLKFMERARSDLLRLLGIDQRVALEGGEGIYAVASLSIDYCKPAKFDDELVVKSRLQELRGASCVVAQSIERGAETIARAQVTVAFISLQGRPRRQPADWVQRLKPLLAAPGQEAP